MGFEMIFIFLLALVLFGPKRLPEMAREIGKFVAEFKRASNDFKYQLQSEIEKAAVTPAPASQTGAPQLFGSQTGASQSDASQPGAQQPASFTQTLLPPAANQAMTGIDDDHE